MNSYEQHYNQDIGYGVSAPRKRKIMELLGDLKGKKVLDAGCASGYLGREMKNAGASEVIGVDISADRIREAKKIFDNAFALDIQEAALPFPDGYFDIVLLAEVIEHLFSPEKAVKEIKRILKSGGEIVVTTPNFLVFSNRIKMLFGKFRYTDTGFLDKGHIRFFTRRTLFEFARDNGLAVVAENKNNIIHPKIPKFLGKIFPNLFVFQLIIRMKKI